jgi:RHS repeat-associated protein
LYDPFGRRIQKKLTQGASTTTNYLYDGFNSLEEVDQSGNVLARYTQGPVADEPLTELRAGTASYYQADGLGSITSLTNSASTIVGTYSYDAFGNLSSTSGSITNPFRYTAREMDSETDTYYYRARYYDQNIGRFISEDPTRFKAGIDFYRYVFNNPVRFGDPSGLDVQVCYYPFGGPFGHTGFGVSGESGTQGFYPLYDANSPWYRQPQRAHGPGSVKPDVDEGQFACIWIPTTPDQDRCMLNCRKKRKDNPGTYDGVTRQCTSFVRDCLKECGIHTANYTGPWPDKFVNDLAISLEY